MHRAPALELRQISKSFGPVKALRGVDFSVRAGEIHALAGENGAGKSTLMNIADGILHPDSGEIRVDGRPVSITSPLEAQRLGIGLVHQEIALCPDVTVAENIFMAATALSSRLFTDQKALAAKAQRVMDRLLPIPVNTMVRTLSIAEQQLVEIAKALTLDCKVLILDEPTAALTETEAETLFGLMKTFREQGMAQVYISHRMSEIFDLCDRITVFRDGQHVSTNAVADMTPRKVVDNLVGRTLDQLFPAKADIRTDRVKFIATVFTSLMAGLAGVIYMARLGSATPSFGVGMELNVIAAAVIGGASLKGGTGSIIGAVLGIALLSIVTSSLILLNVSAYWQEMTKGIILLAAVSFDHILNHYRTR